MPTLKQRFARTIFNWRWWLVLPLFPPMFAIILIERATKTTIEEFDEIINWVHGDAP